MKQFYRTFRKNLLEKSPTTNKEKAWSRTVFSILGKMAAEKGLCCWARQSHFRDNRLLEQIKKITGPDIQEYMVDMCWSSVVNRRDWSHKRIEVAIECEWSRDIAEIVWDFAKLLDINATRKVFIYDSGRKKRVLIEDSLREIIELYDPNRLFACDQILLIDINDDGFKYICWGIEKSKKIKELFLA